MSAAGHRIVNLILNICQNWESSGATNIAEIEKFAEGIAAKLPPRGKVTVSLTRAQWLTLLLAADCAAWSGGDFELLENMFPTKPQQKSFVTAMNTINAAIQAGYEIKLGEGVR